MTPRERSEKPAGQAGAPPGLLRRALKRTLTIVLLACFTFAVFAVALVLTAPASTISWAVRLPPQVIALEGALLDGRARLEDGFVLDWQAEPAGLLAGRLQATLRLSGPETLLTGTAAARRGRVRMRGLNGRLAPGFLALVPNLPELTCNSRAVVREAGFFRGAGRAGASGRIEVEAGTCTRPERDDIPVPTLHVALATEGSDALATLTSESTTLASARLTGEDRLLLRVEPAGAELVPGMPSSAATVLEYPLSF